MKVTGIVRRIDELGRVVIPKSIRDVYGWEPGTPVEIFTDGEKVILREYAPGCVLCGTVENDLHELYPNKLICTHCIERIGRLVASGDAR